jgi:hypothetical protein
MAFKRFFQSRRVSSAADVSSDFEIVRNSKGGAKNGSCGPGSPAALLRDAPRGDPAPPPIGNPELPHLEGVRLLTECWEKQDEPAEAA